jgi:hypothetical protein
MLQAWKKQRFKIKKIQILRRRRRRRRRHHRERCVNLEFNGNCSGETEE